MAKKIIELPVITSLDDDDNILVYDTVTQELSRVTPATLTAAHSKADWSTTDITLASFIKNKPDTITTEERAKLTTVEANATIDQTGPEIKTLYEAEPNTNPYIDSDKDKLSNIAPNATIDQLGPEIKALYEAEPNTNPLTDTEQDKLTVLDTITLPYSLFVLAGHTGTLQLGTALYPFSTIDQALLAASDGDSIFLSGEFLITSEILLPSDKSVHFTGATGTRIGYHVYDNNNGKIFNQPSSSSTKDYSFDNLILRNSGDYGIYIRSCNDVQITNCELFNNGWTGNRLSTRGGQTDTWANGGTLGYDSSQADLQAFYASSEVGGGGAMRIRSFKSALINDNKAYKNLRGFRIQDGGTEGKLVVEGNDSYDNLESGIYLASGSYSATGGNRNASVRNNKTRFNANNGILLIGGFNNVVHDNQIEGNWNAGLMAWHCSNTKVRDLELDNNNRSAYNGIGNNGDAKASIQISGGTLHSDADYLIDIRGVSVDNSGAGTNTDKVGLFISDDVDNINNRDKAIIVLKDISFRNQDKSEVIEADLDKVKVIKGGMTYENTTSINTETSAGAYSEVPYSSSYINLNTLDFAIDSTGSQVAVKESSSGNVLDYYGINQLQAVAFGTSVRIMLKGSNKIQYDNVPVSGVSIGGVSVNSVLNLAVDSLNGLFTNTSGFAAGGNPVIGFQLVGGELVITLSDSTTHVVDIASLTVDSNNYVVSGALSGENLVLTMSDASTVSIDARNMINGSTLTIDNPNWFIAFGADSGTQVTVPALTSSLGNKTPINFGQTLSKGHEFIWQHDTSGNLHIGLWSGGVSDYTPDAQENVNWDMKLKITTNKVDSSTSSGNATKGTDIDSRFSSGYSIASSTVFALRYGQDSKLALYDITEGNAVLIAQQTLANDGNPVTIFMTGQSTSYNTKFPSFIDRTDLWNIVHDYDDSESGEWRDGIEQRTIIQSNIDLVPGKKYSFSLPPTGHNRYYGLGWSGAPNGVNDVVDDTLMLDSWRWQTSEVIQNAHNWDFNTFNSKWTGSYWQDTGPNNKNLELRYNTDNTLQYWDADTTELIMERTVPADGLALNLTFGATGYASNPDAIPVVTISDIAAVPFGTIPALAPDVSDQVFNVQENDSINFNIGSDVNSDLITMYAETDAPSWFVLNQGTGNILGTAPAFTGSTDSYVINCKAANPFGSSSFTITVNVTDTPAYSNTKAIQFDITEYLGANASLLEHALGRSGNGSGSSDSWSISFWFKPSTSGNNSQTIFYFGSNDGTNGGTFRLTYMGGDERFRLKYGPTSNNLLIQSSPNTVPHSTWVHCLATYDGGTTENGSGGINDSYSRFKMFLDGVEITYDNSNSNFGYSGAITADNLRVGKFVSGNTIRDNGVVDEVAVWNTDQTLNITNIYNGGNTQDLAGLGQPPSHYWRMGDGDTFPTIQDQIGTAHFVMNNMISTDIINDVVN